MKIRPICPYSFGANTYLLTSGCHAFAVDPAVSVEAIVTALSEEGAQLEGILLTHGHFDHTVSVDTLRAALKVPVYVHSRDAEMLTDGKKNGFYTFYGKECVHGAAEKLLDDGDLIPLGDEEIRVLHTPGHSKGSVCYHCGSFLITGDTLFSNSIGRCDLYGGSDELMCSSLEELRKLDPRLTIYPGHGASEVLRNALDCAAYYL